MNWVILGVIIAVVLLIPAALYATFANTRDSYDFARHYSGRDFSPELPEDRDKGRLADESRQSETLRQQRDTAAPPPVESESSPVAEWPREL